MRPLLFCDIKLQNLSFYLSGAISYSSMGRSQQREKVKEKICIGWCIQAIPVIFECKFCLRSISFPTPTHRPEASCEGEPGSFLFKFYMESGEGSSSAGSNPIEADLSNWLAGRSGRKSGYDSPGSPANSNTICPVLGSERNSVNPRASVGFSLALIVHSPFLNMRSDTNPTQPPRSSGKVCTQLAIDDLTSQRPIDMRVRDMEVNYAG